MFQRSDGSAPFLIVDLLLLSRPRPTSSLGTNLPTLVCKTDVNSVTKGLDYYRKMSSFAN